MPEDQLLPLSQMRQRIQTSLTRSANLAFLVTAGVSVLGCLLSLSMGILESSSGARALTWLGLAVAASIALLISKRKSPQWAIGWLAASSYMIIIGISIWVGLGVSSAASIAPVAVVVVIGFLNGPRMAMAATIVACLGSVGMLGLESAGMIPGLTATNKPPAALQTWIQCLVFVLIGMTTACYSKLFWDAMLGLDQARIDLLAKIETQSRTQAALLESRQRLNALLDHVPMSVLILAPGTGRLHYANHHALSVHGVQSTEELEAQCLFPPDSTFTRDSLRRAIATVHEQGSLELRWPTRHASGREICWSASLHPSPTQDADHLVVYGEDITARLQAEQALQEHQQHLEEQVRDRTDQIMQQQRRLEGIIDALPVALCIKDREGRYQLGNRLFTQEHHQTKGSLIGKTVDELWHAEMAAEIRQQDQALLNGAPLLRYEFSGPGPSGLPLDVLVTKVALLDADGQPESVLTLEVDIADIKSLQRDLDAAKNEAERLTRVMSEFLANMSHEIRTPLHGVLGLARVGQARHDNNPDTTRLFEKINQSGQHLLGIIDNTLDFSKIEAGKLALSECAIDPRQIAANALSMVEARAREKGLSLSMDAEPLDSAILGDPLRIGQILINLLSNAVKFTRQGSIHLTMRTQDQQLIYAIQDTGIGMHPEAQQRVFSPFEQADGSTSRRFGGTGLGLSISQQLAHLMGGEIQLQSALGKGSTFTLTLPLHLTDEALMQPTMPAPLSERTEPARDRRLKLSGLRILAVDDVDINREIIAELLTHEGAELTMADSGKQALSLIKQQPGWFDMVLMDVQMPVMNGMQATELVHMVDKSLPVVALTAHALPEECERFAEAGMVAHIAKPFDPKALTHLILRHARRAPTITAQPAGESPQPRMDPTDPRDFDLDGAMRRCGGKSEVLHRLVARFRDEQLDFMTRCIDLLETAPIDAQHLAHRLKGTSANLGMPILAQHAGELEAALKAQDASAAALALQSLDGALQQHIVLINEWLLKESATV